MPSITRQIIRDVVKEEIHSALEPLEQRFDGLEQRFDGLEQRFDGLEQSFDGLEQKVDTVITQLTDIAGQFKKFDEEQTVLSGQMSDRTDRIEKLEIATFGAAAA